MATLSSLLAALAIGVIIGRSMQTLYEKHALATSFGILFLSIAAYLIASFIWLTS